MAVENIDYVYWSLTVVIGLGVAFALRFFTFTWRSTVGVVVLGIALLALGLFLGLTTLSEARPMDLFLFNKQFTPSLGVLEFRLIAMAYGIFIGVAIIAVRTLFGRKNSKASNLSSEQDA